jgi:hypothetical protein
MNADSPPTVETAYGPLSRASFERLYPNPLARILEWPWIRPYPAILAFTGYSLDRLVNDPRAAAEVRTLWRLWHASRRLAAEHERELGLTEILWWRAMGCPVACPLCGRLEACACGERQPFAKRLRAMKTEPGGGATRRG